MATVKQLIDFYNNQNSLAVSATNTTAALKAEAQQRGADRAHSAAIEQNRLKQEEQLRRFSEAMENMRQNRQLGSSERIALAQLQAEDARGLSRQAFEGSQNEADRQLQQQIAQFSEAGANQRAELDRNLRMELGQMNLEADRSPRQLNPEEASLVRAQARESNARANLIGQPDRSTLIQDLARLAELKEAKAISKDEYRRTSALIKQQLEQLTNAPADSIPEVAEIETRDVAERKEEVLRGLDEMMANVVQTQIEVLEGRIAQATAELEEVLVRPDVPESKKKQAQKITQDFIAEQQKKIQEFSKRR